MTTKKLNPGTVFIVGGYVHMTYNQELIILCLMISACFFSGCGSRSSDFSTGVETENPLPPCPDTPNCVRITEKYPAPVDSTWEAVLAALQQMKPHRLEPIYDEYRFETSFIVLFFVDDMVVQLDEGPTESGTSYVHIRSSSRVGRSDFGVNRKRVRTFLELMRNKQQSD